ncbi:NAD-dependent epimerase/dehydratase family protein [Mycolicibacterium aubagnense]|uniref:Oxidoreductase n=1 Tax=Mycolicibacterium aubagnense TaxID=319707 RepID=A0ABN5YRA3_9MYCO|nr:NAD(P)-dependent oxidoreductase [Mycolicibacterium aubagnense]TLH59550.1 NAD(P)-dependent oxidoreductase [Mycolicibacterium aubagnense]WGI34606.1 NAD(P)-dependent oxidoreductase [Mycolicibacterium aubagnense]BBX83512.1 oxidoreductase [Mycolicibacterium aubagnense]
MTDQIADVVLITGAFGQVGKRCAEILLRRGRTVIAMDLQNDKTTVVADELATRSDGGTLVVAYADLLDADTIAECVSRHRPAAIVHLAAMLAPASYRNPLLARRINVDGTHNLVAAARSLSEPPLFVDASSASVYGSRNRYTHPQRITADTPVNPVDQYGEDKVLAEEVVRSSGLPYAVLRLGGVISTDVSANFNTDYLVLMRATPRDNQLHTVDARDVALAFANAVDRRDAVNGKTLLIGGDDTHLHTFRDVEDDIMEAVGVGRLGPSASLPGDPEDDRGWGFTGFFDTSEAQALLDFQEHSWSETLAWVADSLGRLRPVLWALGPAIRPVLRTILAVQRKVEGRGRYADPWALIEKNYGPGALASGQARSGAGEPR